MSAPIVTMKRYELKYILSAQQVEALKKGLEGHMKADEYGLTSIASLYYDTPDFRLIRTSLERLEFKEKIRLRSYGLAKEDSRVFLELKRKAYGIVYKRRVATTQQAVEKFLDNDGDICSDGQIAKEITYFRSFYKKLIPACLIIYDRVAYFEPDGDLRLTIDYDPRYRTTDLDLSTSMEGISLLEAGQAILEVKVQDAIPLWLAEILAKNNIQKNNFSKYGEAYKKQLCKGFSGQRRAYV